MSTVTAQVATVVQEFPAGTVEGPWRWAVSDGQSFDRATPDVVFTVTEPGTYTVTVQRFAADGVTPLGPQASAEIVIEQRVFVQVVGGAITHIVGA